MHRKRLIITDINHVSSRVHSSLKLRHKTDGRPLPTFYAVFTTAASDLLV
jgi:hypothetical protein